MQVKELLMKSQPIVYKTIKNGFEKKKTSHAYLVSGGKGMPVKQTALFLAQCFLCDNNRESMACEDCVSCTRVKEGTYADLIFIDGEKETIKKEMIDNLQTEFTKTALEEKGLKIYIIHLVEKATSSAINGLLKFLEEPSDDVVAILTCENQTKVLPTIISRCQILRLKATSKLELKERLFQDGIDKDDAVILSSFYNDYDEVNIVIKEGFYQEIKDLAVEAFTCLKNYEDFPYFMQRNVEVNITKKEQCILFLGILELLFKNALLKDNSLFESDLFTLDLDKEEIEWCIHSIIMNREKLDLNANIALMLDDLSYSLTYKKGGK